MLGADLMAKAIQRQGVKTVFGIPGHLEVFFGSLQREQIRLINMRHESSVVLAAEGYARIRRGLGVGVVTAGPGLANALGGLISAFDACTPLLLITGRNEFHLSEAGNHQEMDHPRVVREMTKWSQTVHDPARLAEFVDMACRIALSGRPGPVLLEVPRDVALAKVDDPAAERWLKPLIRPRRPRAHPDDIERAAALIGEAKRPLILAGAGAYWGEAEVGLRRLADEAGLPVTTRALARGMLPEDMEHGFPWYLGFPAATEADVVLFAGTRMRSGVSFAAPPYFRADARFAQIDIDGSEIGRNQPVAAPVVGDCGHALEGIADALARNGYKPRDKAWLHEAIAAKLARIDTTGREESGKPHPLRIARELAGRMPGNSIFVGDGANSLSWFRAILRMQSSPSWMDHEPFGSMGVGLPMAIGAVAAEQESGRGRPVFLAAGDGAIGEYIAELATASLHKLPMLVMIGNDGGWGASRGHALRHFNDTYGCEMAQSRYDIVAEGLDCHGEFVDAGESVTRAFDRALDAMARGRPAVINYIIDRDSPAVRNNDPLLVTLPFNRSFGVKTNKERIE